jgi:hypothetical protein
LAAAIRGWFGLGINAVAERFPVEAAAEIAVASCLRRQGPSKQPVVTILPKPFNRWFVSVGPVHGAWKSRQTKGFPTETEAKRFAKEVLSKAHCVTAGTITPHQPKRRTIADYEIAQWIEGEK